MSAIETPVHVVDAEGRRVPGVPVLDYADGVQWLRAKDRAGELWRGGGWGEQPKFDLVYVETGRLASWVL